MDQKLFRINGRFSAGMALALLICLSFATVAVGVSWAQGRGKAAAMQGKKLGKVLRPDGTLDLKSGYRGGLDPTGYRMVSGSGEQPRFAVGSAPGDARWSDRFGPASSGVDGAVWALVVDGNGNLYAGGDFNHAGGVATSNIAKWDGSAWSALGSGMEGSYVAALAVDGSGNLYAGGQFSTAGGLAVNNIAKWDGNAWSALGDGISAASDPCVLAIAFDESGNLYAGGYFSTAGGVAASHIAKWDGSAWSALGHGINGYVYALAVDGNGNLYAGGTFTIIGGVAANKIAKWDGSAWSELGSGMNGGYVAALVFDGSGNLYAGGQFGYAGGVSAKNIAKWSGSAWSALAGGVNVPVVSLAFAVSGSLYAGGFFVTAGWNDDNHIAKWDGQSWSALKGGIQVDNLILGPPIINALALDANENLYAGGYFNTAGVALGPANSIAKWDGSSWSTLANGLGLDNTVLALAISVNGDLYAGGYFSTASGVAASHIAKWDGNAFSALGSGVDGYVYALASDGSGNLYAGGVFTTAGGVSANSIAKWDGHSWSALGSGVNGSVWALAVDGSGSVYAGGDFTAAGGNGANNIAKWDGSTWSPLGVGVGSHVYALAADGKGNLYAGGEFTTAGGLNAIHMAKWNGRSWSWPAGCGMGGGGVYALAFDGSGNLYAGGYFTTAGGVAASHIAKWNGSAWSALGSGVNSVAGSYPYPYGPPVCALAFDGNGNLYATGKFTSAGGVPAKIIATWDGSAWSPLGSGLGGSTYAIAFALAVSESGTVYAGGYFSTAGGKPSNHIAQWGDPFISGTVRENGAPLSGVTIILSGASSGTATTGADGTYRFAAVPEGAYVIKASSDEYVFSPASRTVDTRNGAGSGQDFAATRAFSVSGSVKEGNAPVAGVTMRLSGAAAKTVLTGADGGYRFTGLLNGVYVVTPGKNPYTFTPGSRTFNVNGADVGGQDFACEKAIVTIAALGPNSTEWGTKGSFRVTRTGSTSFGLSVKYTVGGTASNGSDYNTLSGSVTIPAGASFANITVTPVNDSEAEGMETVTATLSADPNYTVGSPDSATVRIAGDDGVVAITALVPNATEWGTKGYFRVSRTGSTGFALNVKYTVGGTATGGVNYQSLSGTVTIPAGKTFANIAVIPVDDSVAEGMKAVVATLSADQHYIVGSPDSATVKIADNDAVVTITARVPIASESGTKGYFQVSRTGSTTSGLVVKYTVGGTATTGIDYQDLSGSVTIQAGKSFANVAVIPINDTVHEGTETVVATLSANPYYIVGSPNSATVNIADND